MKTKLPLLLSVAFAAALVSGCWNFGLNQGVKGSGNIAKETRTVTGFDRVQCSGSGRLVIVQGDQEGLTLEADDNLLPLLKSEVVDGVLKLGPDQVNVNPTRTILYRVQLKNLKELHLSGSLEAEAASVKSDDFAVHISGSGKVQLGKLEASSLQIHISGSGDVELAGKTKNQTIQISGSGNYRAGNFESQDTSVQVSGSGDATVWARGALNAHVSGSGDIKYYGSPQVDSHVSGSGGVHPLGERPS